jgi:hypothetical protein
MKKQNALSFVLIMSSLFSVLVSAQDTVVIKKISDEIFTSGECYKNLEYLCKKIGPRLSASPGAEKAVQWTNELMKNYGFDKVYLQEVMVPHWERGEKETGKVISGSSKETPVNIVALGGSIATPKEGMTAEIIEVKDFDELKKMGKEKIQGKIVFYNYPFDVKKIIPFDMYGAAAKYRTTGAIEAARYGAVASITRSMTNYLTAIPNTGAMHYNDSVNKIPACAISTLDAEWLSDLLKKEGKAKIFIKTSCQILPDVKSYNVIGEMTGTEKPDEIIVVGGHLDSWDLGEGAHDDGAGCMESIEALRVFKKLGIKPKRTIRAVMFMNEENGLKGGMEYAKQAGLKKENHILAIESDAGGFTPRGFTMTMSDDSLPGGSVKKAKIMKWKDYFYPYGAYDFTRKGGGADISPLKKLGVSQMELSPDNQRYFVIHHTSRDTFEEVNRRELELSSVVLTMMVYLVSEYGL